MDYANLSQLHVGSYYMGWGYNLKDPVSANDPHYWTWIASDPSHPEDGQRGPKAAADFGSISDVILRRNPVFDPGWGQVAVQAFQENPVSDTAPVQGAPPWIFNLYLSTGGNYVDEATHHNNRAWLMAEAIPALSWAVGSHNVDAFENRNYPLTALVDQSGHWPRGKDHTNTPVWQHSDLRNVAYVYLYQVFDQLKSLSNQ